MILSIDTTSEYGSLALTDTSGTQDQTLLHAPEGFGQILFGEIAVLLSRHGLNVHDIEAFAVTSGPGSFTGVRVGLAAAKGLAEGTGRPVIAVSNLQVLAFFGDAPLRATVLDARRGDVYCAVYDSELGLISAETVMKFSVWAGMLPKAGLQFIARDFTAFQPFADPTIAVVTAPPGLAAAVGQIAWQRLNAGLVADPAGIDANYVRRSDAELFWKE